MTLDGILRSHEFLLMIGAVFALVIVVIGLAAWPGGDTFQRGDEK